MVFVKGAVMHSLRAKITLMTAGMVIIVMAFAAAFGASAIRDSGEKSASGTLLLLCEAGEKNLDSYFDQVEQSVKMVSAFVESDLASLEEEELSAHLDRTRAIFQNITNCTKGVLTYYYRIDPEISGTVKGFWYVDLDGNGFREHEVTDITQYDTSDTNRLVWFTVPKFTGKPVWLPPYITDNLDQKVISYNVPVFLNDRFVGVIGIELDYAAMAEQVNNITLYEDGYAFLSDEEGNLVYHPRMDVTQMMNPPKLPAGPREEGEIKHYTFEGVEKQAARLPLHNGMWLNVSVPVDEINAGWKVWVKEVLIVSGVMLVCFIAVAMIFSERITKPLRDLAAAAEQIEQGNFDVQMNYDGKDEVGILTRTFRHLSAHLKAQISSLNDLAYADALTSLRNKGAFDIYMENLQRELDTVSPQKEFAIVIFDCNNLKKINDTYGHDKGDIFLKNTSSLICRVFQHSPVFRIGGDEFAAYLTDEDYRNREDLLRTFDTEAALSRETEPQNWDRVNVARGIAVYDPSEDKSVNDVFRRADKRMYDDKWNHRRALRSI